MNQSTGRAILGVSLAVLFAASACGKSSSSPATGGGSGGQTGNGSGGASPISGSGGATPVNLPPGCTQNAIKVVFSPMYSAFVPGHSFKLPVVVNGLDQSAVTWSASDPTMVDIADDLTTGGAMLTMQKAGTVNIIATAGTVCGIAPLTISAGTENDLMAGSARYNDGVKIVGLPGRGDAGVVGADAATAADGATARDAACTNCHGDTATDGLFKTVAHTPEQAGGFSDADLKNIFMNGMVPTGGYFDPMIVPYRVWQGFHHWTMTDDEAKGIIVYLRSLTPTKQTGAGNFGGAFGDGGVPDGGRRRDGGGGDRRPPGADADPTSDTAADTASD